MTSDAAAPSHSNKIRRGLFAVGLLLTAVSVVYLVQYVYRHWQELPPLRLTGTAGLWLAGAGLLYFSSLLTTAGAWFYAVRTLAGKMTFRIATAVALTSQIGKYAPGNVAHHLGRAALAGNRGVPLPVIAKATLMEIVTAVLAGGAIALIGIALSPAARELAGQISVARPSFTVLLVLAAAVVVLGGAVWASRARRELSWGRAIPLAGLLRMFGCYLFSFLFAGLSYWAAVRAFGQTMDPAFCAAVYALAWVIGFVTPGAPAGLGVRESVLVIATSAALGPAAITVAIAHRLVTAVAEAAAAAIGAVALLPRKAER